VSSTARHRLTHARSATLTLIGLSCIGLALTGCGGGLSVAPSLTTTAQPTGFIVASYPSAGVELSVPHNWTITPEKAPMIAVFSSGAATMALWRYPSSAHALPTTFAQLRAALTALAGAIRQQDPSVQITATGTSRVGSAGAVILDALERIDGQPRRVRSEHVYLDGAELVLEAYAPVSEFSRVDHAVFSPVRKSLTLLHDGQPSSGQSTTSTTVTPAPEIPTSTSVSGSTATRTGTSSSTATATPTPTATGSGTGAAP
jgi:hypothetical protein